MKTNFTHFASACLLMTGALPVVAQTVFTPTHVDKNSIVQVQPLAAGGNATCNFVQQGNSIRMMAPAQAPAADENTVTVNFEFNYDYALFEDPDLWVIGENRTYYFYFPEDINVPAGKYDIVMRQKQDNYTAASGYSGYVYRFVVREQVDLTEGMTLSFDPFEASTNVSFGIYNPQGEKCQQSRVFVDADLNDQMLEQGNIDDMWYSNFLVHKESGQYIGFMGNLSKIYDYDESLPYKNTDNTDALNFYINPVSDRFAFVANRFFYTDQFDAFYHVSLQTDYVADQEICNDPADYYMFDAKFAQTPKGNEILQSNPYPMFALSGVKTKGGSCDGFQMYFKKPLGEDMTFPYYSNCNLKGEPVIKPCFKPCMVDGATYNEFVGVYSYNDCEVEGPWVMVEDGELAYWGNVNYVYGRVADEFSGWKYSPDAFGNPVLKYPVNQTDMAIGGSCPIIGASRSVYGPDFVYIMFSDFTGRMGEVNAFDRENTKVVAYQDGELVEESENYYFLVDPMNTPDSEYDVTCSTDNVCVDGLYGKSSLTLHFNHKNTDLDFPLIQTLDFQRADGFMTDRFATGAEATLRFYAGDFNVNPDCAYNYLIDPLADVQVSCAPFESDEWQNLDVTENVDLFHAPNHGFFYTSSLAGVKGVNESGWFDLKIRVTDMAGNYSEQVVSPAFRLDDHKYSSVDIKNINAGDFNANGMYLNGKNVVINHSGRQFNAFGQLIK